MKRSLLLVAALAALAPAGAAEAAPFKEARFVAYVEGKQVTTWNIPRYNTYFDCQGQRWEQGQGQETIRFRTKPTRILVSMAPRASTPQMKVGTWNRFSQSSAYSLSATGKVERSGQLIRGIDPSVCHDAGDPTVEDTGPYDCGTLAFNPEVTMSWRRNRVEVRAIELALPIDGSPTEFETCPVEGPVEPFEGSWTDISQRYPVRDVFDRSQGLIEVLGRKSWTEKIHRDHGTATTTTTFKLRLRRAR